MASFDDLPADQQAVLSMVLKQGRNFDQIAALLNVDRAGIRQRALDGFDALGPDTTLEPLKRALITDYLLGQLPPAVARNVAASLADSPPERAWARIVAAEIAPLAVHGMPEIPAAGSKPAAAPVAAEPTLTDTPAVRPRRSTGAVPSLGASASSGGRAAAGAADPARTAVPPAELPRSSRRGGAILIGIITIVVVVVVVILVATGGSSKKKTASTPSTTAPQQTVSGSSAPSTGTGTGTTAVKPIHTIPMVAASGSKTIKGGADVVKDGSVLGLVILGEGLAANTKNAYGVWLYNSKTQKSDFLGFYGQKVAATGKAKGILEAEVKLPTGATSYNELLLTLETVEKPTKPGTIVLEGEFAE